MNAIRVFIYGSCVTRDAEPWFSEHGLEMVGYVARQSLISAFQPANSDEFVFSDIRSAFQRRMMQGDVRGNLRFEIQKSQPDIVLWDLCDERLGVKKVGSGGAVTAIRDHVSEKIHPGPMGRRQTFGSDDHFSAWSRALANFVTVMERYGLENKVYLNTTPWAAFDDGGASTGLQAKLFNDAAERYIALAAESGIKIVRIPDGRAVASSNHKWGPAPFHYVDATYLAMLRSLSETL